MNNKNYHHLLKNVKIKRIIVHVINDNCNKCNSSGPVRKKASVKMSSYNYNSIKL